MTATNDQDYSSLDDAALIALARKDKHAFGVLYERHVKNVYGFIYAKTQNQHDAEDLTARVFQRALSHIGTYQERGVPFGAWLIRIARNLVANFHRDRSRRKVVPLEEYVTGIRTEEPEATTIQEEEKELLLEAVKRLPEERQELIILKIVNKLSNQEIGEIMGRSEGAIKSLFHRTLQALREELVALEQSESARRHSR
jgi:RNA polymerase sigma-70 factor (ECF subfamily)